MVKIPVNEIYPFLEMMLRDKWGYIMGTAGILWTQARQDATENEMAQKYGKKWIGHMVTDCSGVPPYIWKKLGLVHTSGMCKGQALIPHGSNSMVKQGYIGELSKTPKPGYAALKYKPATNDYYHIGIVYKDGKTVYESKGTIAGFVTSDVSEWDLFGPFTQVDYTDSNNSKENIKMEPYFAVITGDKVRVRSGPGTTFTKVSEVNKGDIVTVSSESGNWVFAEVNGVQGYIYDKYVQKTEVITNPVTEEPTTIAIPMDLAKQLYECLREGLKE